MFQLKNVQNRLENKDCKNYGKEIYFPKLNNMKGIVVKIFT